MSYENVQNLLQRKRKEHGFVEMNMRRYLEDLISGSIDINSTDSTYFIVKGSWHKREDYPNNKYLLSARTPLLTAIGYKSAPLVKALLKDGADVAKCGARLEITPLIEAVKTNSNEIVNILLRNGADPTVNSDLLFGLVIKQGNVGILKKLLKCLVEKEANSIINSCLFLAASSKRHAEEMLKMLLAAGADVNCKDKNGATPLEAYIKRGDVKMVELLLEAGANVNGTTRSGRSLLALALSNDADDMIRLLLAAGAAPLERDEIEKVESLLKADANVNESTSSSAVVPTFDPVELVPKLFSSGDVKLADLRL